MIQRIPHHLQLFSEAARAENRVAEFLGASLSIGVCLVLSWLVSRGSLLLQKCMNKGATVLKAK